MPGRQGLSPSDDDRLVLHVQSTHLYRGARLQTAEPAGDLGTAPRGIRLVFRDGVEVDAELLTNDLGELALEVARYTTGARTTITERVWHAKPIEDAAGAGLVIGARI